MSVMISTQMQPVTIEEVLKSPPGDPWELLEGELIRMAPASAGHGRIANRIAYRLTGHTEKTGQGVVYAAETGYLLSRNPDTLRAPDVSFVASPRVPGEEAHFMEGAPDLAVEVVSPNDRAADVRDKVTQWIDSGARLVWVAWPQTRSITVHRPNREERILHGGDTLDGEDVAPGFTCPVSEIFG